MADGQPIVFLDLETGGLYMRHPVIQIGAVVVDAAWNELETFEAKVKFREEDADPEALAINHYDAKAWADAAPESVVVAAFADLLRRHRSVELISKRSGKPYKVARVAGHNVTTFDLDRLTAMFKRHEAFLAIDYKSVLDTRHGAVWMLWGQERQPKDFKLASLAEHFGIPVNGAHDALVDVRLSIAIARKLREGGSHV